MANESMVVVGFGAMGSAIAAGAVGAGLLSPHDVWVIEPDDERRAEAERLGMRPLDAPVASVDPSALLLLCVKPQVLADAARSIVPVGPRLVVSILAGMGTTRLTSSLATPRVIRAMPNTPASIGRGLTALTPGTGATPEDLERARRLFQSVGEVIELAESLFDAFTALAASGPAYVFHLAEAMIDAGVRVGFSTAQADAIVRATIRGSAELLATTREKPAMLRSRVTSKGGTTAAATSIIESRGVPGALAEAVVAARNRARELGSA